MPIYEPELDDAELRLIASTRPATRGLRCVGADGDQPCGYEMCRCHGCGRIGCANERCTRYVLRYRSHTCAHCGWCSGHNRYWLLSTGWLEQQWYELRRADTKRREGRTVDADEFDHATKLLLSVTRPGHDEYLECFGHVAGSVCKRALYRCYGCARIGCTTETCSRYLYAANNACVHCGWSPGSDGERKLTGMLLVERWRALKQR